ncbi:hypothetical protein [Pirellulimonas nuda]|uniref:hypothetical protein n=1 Tax=Pirellulimonas nuda TaxID=2528009 RepID=UPI0011A24EF3|nr:hypothetical protein [Pirellulimonas nuda]
MLLAMAMATSVSSTALAQENYNWLPAGNGDWKEPLNWDNVNFGNNVPEANFDDVAVIGNGGTAQVTDTRLDVGGINVNSGTLSVMALGNLTSRVGNGGLSSGNVAVGGGGTLHVAGGGVLNVGTPTDSSNLSLAGTYRVELTAADQNPVNVKGTATLGGGFVANVNGATVNAGSTWDVIDATSIAGNFGSVTAEGTPLPVGRVFSLNQMAGGNGSILRLGVEQRLVLTVDRNLNTATIRNAANAAAPINIDSYLIQSATGSINPSGWTSIADSDAAWKEAGSGAVTSNAVAEFNPTASRAFGAGQQQGIGTIFSANYSGIPFGDDFSGLQDYVFTYTNAGQTSTGVVEYVGDFAENNIVLTVNPATGAAAMQNESGSGVSIDSYSIASAAGGLLTSWNSLQDQGGPGGTWLEANASANRLSELTQTGATRLNQNEGFNLGTLFNTASAQDLTFQFLIAGTTTVVNGIVEYGALPTNLLPPSAFNPADYNQDGFVDAADYTVWRDGGSPDSTNAGYLLWKQNFGAGAGVAAAQSSASVPEPCSACLGLIVLSLALRGKRRLCST